MHRINAADIRDDRQLTLAVLQIGQLLGLYNAEVARILGIQCDDIGALHDKQERISIESDIGKRALTFIRFYTALFDYHGGDEIGMYNWLRRENTALHAQPLLLLVDEGRIEEVIRYLKTGSARPS